MSECVVCGHPAWRSEHADWCEDVGALLADGRRPERHPCSEAGCNRLSHARGLCHTHYSDWYRHGGREQVGNGGRVTPLHTGHLSVVPQGLAGGSAGVQTPPVISAPSRQGGRAASEQTVSASWVDRSMSAGSSLRCVVSNPAGLLVLNSKRAGACNASSSTRAS